MFLFPVANLMQAFERPWTRETGTARLLHKCFCFFVFFVFCPPNPVMFGSIQSNAAAPLSFAPHIICKHGWLHAVCWLLLSDLAVCELCPNACRWQRHPAISTGTVTMTVNRSVSVLFPRLPFCPDVLVLIHLRAFRRLHPFWSRFSSPSLLLPLLSLVLFFGFLSASALSFFLVSFW